MSSKRPPRQAAGKKSRSARSHPVRTPADPNRDDRHRSRSHAWKRLLGSMAVVAVLGATVHWPMLSSQALSLDDGAFLTDNTLVQNPSLASGWTFFAEVLEPSTVGGYYLPLAMNSLMLDYALGGRPSNLRPFHRTSLMIHVLNACLLIALLTLLFGQPWVAACVGLLFVVHPLTVEPTVWVGERKTLLAACFALIAILAYVRSVHVDSRALRWAAVGAYVLSLLSKPTAIALPVVLVLLDAWPLRRLSWTTVREKAWFGIVAALSVVITLISHARTAGFETTSDPWRTPLMICRNVVFYFKQILWPSGLTSHYEIPEPLRIGDPAVLAGVIGVIVMIALLALSLRWTRAAAVGTAIFFVLIFPTLGLVQYSWVSASDKYVYLPVIGLLLVLAALMGRWWQSGRGAARTARRTALVGLVLVLSAMASAGTRAYIAKWRDSETLFRHMAELAPRSPRAHDMLGNVLLQAGDYDGAMASYVRATALDPAYPSAQTNVGNLLYLRGDVAAAKQRWALALEADSSFADAYVNLGIALTSEARDAEAIRLFQRALQLNPRQAYASNLLGLQMVRLGRIDEATRLLTDAIRFKGNYADAHLNLATVLLEQDDVARAIAHLAAAERYADGPATRAGGGNAYLRLGRSADAARVYGQALAGLPNDVTLRNNYVVALVQTGRFEAARTEALRVLELDPEHLDARINLAFVVERLGDVEAAIGHYREVLRIDPDHVTAKQRLQQVLDRTAAP